MLITELKEKEIILSLIRGRVFLLHCHGCREIRFPTEEAAALQQELAQACMVTGILTTDYICNPDHLKLRLDHHAAEIQKADTVLVFSCGVGVQTVADAYPDKRVCAACDTYRLPGFQGVTPLEHDCDQCGQCFLNLTGGICPLTACSKGLLNGPCGGARNGKCEVDPDMDCGWERITKRLTAIGRTDALKCPVQVRNYATDADASKESSP